MNGLTALVSGGGSGIGLCTAKMLLDEGANVVIAGRDTKKLKAAVAEINCSDGRLKYVSCDISREAHVNKLIGETINAFGSLHILVNNAGLFRMGSIFDMTEEDYDDVADVNLKGTWFMCKFGGKAIAEAGGGVIINVASLLGIRGATGYPTSAYSAAKGGVLALTRALAIELAPLRIRVNAVIPAIVNTPMLSSVGDDQVVQDILESSKKFHPLGRAGEPEDVARAILFLARSENSWISGAELPVDGGRSVL
jgi:NAD(P)-dependent dehydrogenase (short-subunit alcohol dehydrogenase family)